MGTTVVISCTNSDDPRMRMKEDVLALLFSRRAKLPVLLVPHIYHSPEEGRFRQKLAAIGGPIVLLSWLNPRPAEWVLRWYGLQGPILALNIGAYEDPEACFAAFAESGFRSEPAGAPECVPDANVREIDFDLADRWYPVVDGSRCANCKQCLQFCLFGVYELDEGGKVFVRNPDNCKPGCPACSRICPRGAIMFPLHEDAAIAGAPGKLMVPDAKVKAAFYERTKRPCPVCGSVHKPGQRRAAGTTVCSECGRPINAPAQAGQSPRQQPLQPPAPQPRKPGDDLDSLIDDLERLR